MSENAFFQTDQINPDNNDVEIIDFSAEPYGDDRRVKFSFRLSFFREPPNAAIILFGADGEEIASVDVVNLFHPENAVTLHIPKSRAQEGEYQAELTLFKLEQREAQADEEGEYKLETQNLHSRRITFTLQ